MASAPVVEAVGEAQWRTPRPRIHSTEVLATRAAAEVIEVAPETKVAACMVRGTFRNPCSRPSCNWSLSSDTMRNTGAGPSC